MNKLPLANLPISNAAVTSYERILNVKLNEIFGIIRASFNTLIQNFASGTTTTVTTNTTLTAAQRNVYVTTSALTITMPLAKDIEEGVHFNITLGVVGYVDIVRNSADSWLHTIDPTLRLNQKGASIVLKPISSTIWSIV